jgi:hypothetical protein
MKSLADRAAELRQTLGERTGPEWQDRNEALSDALKLVEWCERNDKIIKLAARIITDKTVKSFLDAFPEAEVTDARKRN